VAFFAIGQVGQKGCREERDEQQVGTRELTVHETAMLCPSQEVIVVHVRCMVIALIVDIVIPENVHYRG